MTTLPKINRRNWLALDLQDRRRHRRAPLLRPQYPDLLVWEWPYANPYQWRVYWSNTPDGPWNFVEDYWHYGDSRQFAPDGGSPYHLIVGVDQLGNEVTGRSNAVRPDDAPVPDTLLEGLHDFYRPEAGQVFARSYGVSDAFDGNPMAGFVAPTVSEGSGSYTDVEPSFRLVAFREVSGVRRYATVIQNINPGYISSGSVVWPAWGTLSNWPTGFLLVWSEGPDGEISREVSAATMAAGWVDDGTGWTVGLPFSYAVPPIVSKTLFRRPYEGAGAGGTPATVTSPLGGLAFDLTNGDLLTRQMFDDPIRRSMDVTIAYWVCPALNGYYSTMFCGGSWTVQFFCEHPDSNLPDMTFNGYNFYDSMPDCQADDWFLVVQRGDTFNATLTQDVFRLRDGQQQTHVAPLWDEGYAGPVAPLNAPVDRYFADGLMSALSFGCGFWWGNAGAAYVDRCATWSRPLTDTEVLNLFNNGLGWSPA